MKNLLIITFIFISSCIKAQEKSIPGSPFYLSFFKNFGINSDQLIGNQTAYFFSVLIKTNQAGKVVSMEESKGMDSILTKSVKQVYKKVDRSGLQSYGFKNSTLLLPVFILKSPEDNYNRNKFEQMWAFSSKIGNKNLRILPPLVIYHNLGSGIIIPN